MLPEEWLYAAGRVALKIRTGGSGRAGILIKCGIYWLYWRKWMFFATFIATILLVEVLSFDIWKKVYDFIFLVPQKLMGYVKRKRFFRE